MASSEMVTVKVVAAKVDIVIPTVSSNSTIASAVGVTVKDCVSLAVPAKVIV